MLISLERHSERDGLPFDALEQSSMIFRERESLCLRLLALKGAFMRGAERQPDGRLCGAAHDLL
jgi:hypothetical protein